MSQPPPREPATSAECCHDPELPFLQALEHEVRRSAERAAAAQREARSHQLRAHDRRASGRGATHGRLAPARGRIARRALTLVALVCLIGASAFGASQALSGSGSNPTALHKGAFVLVARGHAGADSWSLRAYRLGGDELCAVLVADENEASRCIAPPAPGTLVVADTVSPQRRYVFGLAGTQLAHVAVQAGGAVQTVVATRFLGPAVARAAGLPPGARYFVAIFARPNGSPDPPARVRGLDGAHHPVGARRTVCVTGAEPQQCG